MHIFKKISNKISKIDFFINIILFLLPIVHNVNIIGDLIFTIYCISTLILIASIHYYNELKNFFNNKFLSMIIILTLSILYLCWYVYFNSPSEIPIWIIGMILIVIKVIRILMTTYENEVLTLNDFNIDDLMDLRYNIYFENNIKDDILENDKKQNGNEYNVICLKKGIYIKNYTLQNEFNKDLETIIIIKKNSLSQMQRIKVNDSGNNYTLSLLLNGKNNAIKLFRKKNNFLNINYKLKQSKKVVKQSGKLKKRIKKNLKLIIINHFYIGKNNEIIKKELISNKLNGKCILINGKQGSGKTQFLEKLYSNMNVETIEISAWNEGIGDDPLGIITNNIREKKNFFEKIEDVIFNIRFNLFHAILLVAIIYDIGLGTLKSSDVDIKIVVFSMIFFIISYYTIPLILYKKETTSNMRHIFLKYIDTNIYKKVIIIEDLERITDEKMKNAWISVIDAINNKNINIKYNIIVTTDDTIKCEGKEVFTESEKDRLFIKELKFINESYEYGKNLAFSLGDYRYRLCDNYREINKLKVDFSEIYNKDIDQVSSKNPGYKNIKNLKEKINLEHIRNLNHNEVNNFWSKYTLEKKPVNSRLEIIADDSFSSRIEDYNFDLFIIKKIIKKKYKVGHSISQASYNS